MGQKANPTSLIVGHKKLWKTLFAEKRLSDVGYLTNIFEIEILKFLEKKFGELKFQMHDYKFFCN